jgi:transposase-like protein
MRRPKRTFSPEFRAKVAIAALKGDKTLAELAEQFALHPNQMIQFRQYALQHMGNPPFLQGLVLGEDYPGFEQSVSDRHGDP